MNNTVNNTDINTDMNTDINTDVISENIINRNYKKLIKNFIRHKWIVLITLLYFIISTIWVLARHNSFLTGGYDLGQYTQIFWNAIRGDGLITDLRIREGNPTGFYLWEHFALILYAFIPIFYMYPSPEILLVIKALFISLSIPILWFVAKNNLDRKLAIVVVVSYILNPFLFRSLNFDFQEQFILPFIVFSMFYFYFEKKYKLFVLSTIIGLTVNEYSAALASASMLGLAITEYLSLSTDNILHIRNTLNIRNILNRLLDTPLKNIPNFDGFLDKLKNRKVYIPLALSVTAGIYFLIVISIMGHYADTGIYASYIDASFEDERISAVETIGYYLTNPSVVVKSIIKDLPNKVTSLNVFLMTTFYLPILSLVSLFPLGLYTIFGWLIDKPTFYSFGNHHALYIIPYAYIGLILSIKNFNVDWNTISNYSRSLIFGLAIIISILLFSYEISNVIDRGSYPTFANHNERLHYIIEKIPENASVLAQNNIQPHLAMRKSSYSGTSQYDQILKTKGFIDFEYVIIDESEGNNNKKQFERISPFVSRLMDINSTDYYGPWLYSDGIYVLKRDYIGPMNEFVANQTEGYKTVYNYKDLKLRSGHIDKGVMIHSSDDNDDSRVFWYGPYKMLLAGNYKVTFNIKKDGNNFDNKKHLITLDIVKNKKDKMISKEVNYSDVNRQWTGISFTISLDTFVSDIEFRGVAPSPGTSIYLKDIIVEELIQENGEDRRATEKANNNNIIGDMTGNNNTIGDR